MEHTGTRGINAIPWRIGATILLAVLFVGVIFSEKLAIRVDGKLQDMIGDLSGPSSVESVRSVWIDSNLWMFGFVLIALTMLCIWLPKLDWFGSILVAGSAVIIPFAICFILAAYWSATLGLLRSLKNSGILDSGAEMKARISELELEVESLKSSGPQ